jgi:predicted ATPase/DNA-binding SARP family transcriptional activator
MDLALEFRVLGPIDVVRNGRSLPLGGRRQQALLALLLLEQGRPVAADRLIDELWRDETPAGASTLPSYVSRLRRALGDLALIEGSTAGYALVVDPERVDAIRFERLVDEGRAALKQHRARRAADRLDAAIGMWRGVPFAGVADEGALHGEADRLEELRLLALEERADAHLALGSGAELVDELEDLVRRHPHRERLWGQLMLALYRAERQADALAVYHRARRFLDEELGLEPGPALQQLEGAILRHEVPDVRAPTGLHDLPTPVTSFVGREAELAEIEQLLGSSRLLTLTGLGGVGKTRLALAAGERALPDFEHGVRFVDLTGIADDRRVGSAVALALDLGELDAASATNVLAADVGPKDLLLVIDNCEHVRTGCADLVTALLRGSPQLRILATSREPLGVAGEVEYLVPPMGLPTTTADPDQVRASESIRLFLSRARAARPGLVEDDRSVATAARICRDLDGLPLAIELAAARAKALSLDDIADRLSDRFRFLVSWRRLTPARQRTLREAVTWSFELLTADEQRFMARLSVFAGEFTIVDAARVCLDGAEARAIELIERLVTTSLLIAEEQDGVMRYRLLETVRRYAEEHLDAADGQELRRAHADHFLKVAQRADLTAVRRGPGQRIDLAIAAQDNLRSALAWSIATGSLTFGLELATSLERYWATHDPREGMRWFEAMLESADSGQVAPAVRANALRAYGGAADIAGEDDLAERLWERSLRLFEELRDEPGQAVLLHRLAISAQRRTDLARATELVERSHRIHERRGNRWGQAQTLGTKGAIARDLGDEVGAFELLEESARLSRQAGVPWWVSGTLAELANLALNAGRLEEAERLARESLTLAQEMGDRAGRIFGVGLLARLAAERGSLDKAATLWAAVEGEDAGAPLGGWRRHRAAYRAVLSDRVGNVAGFGDDEMRTHLDEAVDLALGT